MFSYRDGAENTSPGHAHIRRSHAVFFGGVDWKAVFALRHLAPWGEGGTGNARVAYLFRDTDFGASIKILSAMFTRTCHCGFTDRALAIQWLDSAEQ